MKKIFISFFGMLLPVFIGIQNTNLAAIESIELEGIPYSKTESTWDENSHFFEFEDEVIKNVLSSENEDAKSKNTGVKSTSPIEIKNYSEDISWLENKNIFENSWIGNSYLCGFKDDEVIKNSLSSEGKDTKDKSIHSSESEEAKNKNTGVKVTNSTEINDCSQNDAAYYWNPCLFEFKDDEVIKDTLSSETKDAKDKSTHPVENEIAENENADIKNTSSIDIELDSTFQNVQFPPANNPRDEESRFYTSFPSTTEPFTSKNIFFKSVTKNLQIIDSQVEKNLKHARKNYLTCQKELSIYTLKYIQARRAISINLLEDIEANQNESPNFMRIFVNVFCSEIKCLVANKDIPKMNLNLKINKSGLLECIIKLDSKRTYLFTV